MPDLARNVELVGMGLGDLRSVFSEPALVRVEGNVQYWRYAFAGCSLDLFVDARPDRRKVVHYDLRPSHLRRQRAAAGCERLARQLDQGQKRAAPRRELPRRELLSLSAKAFSPCPAAPRAARRGPWRG
ncbi:MAG: hypothetical protein R3D28_16735 [Geminicoccaceae bacterium]